MGMRVSHADLSPRHSTAPIAFSLFFFFIKKGSLSLPLKKSVVHGPWDDLPLRRCGLGLGGGRCEGRRLRLGHFRLWRRPSIAHTAHRVRRRDPSDTKKTKEDGDGS
jgi:hypothetical protein